MCRTTTRLSFALLCSLVIVTIYSESLAQEANPDDAVSKAREGLIYLQGIGVEIDTARGEALLIESAELGLGPAQLTLGEAYLFGNMGLVRDEEKAFRWLNRALEQNLPLAKYYIGQIYYRGQIVTEDKKKAFQLTLEAAEEGVTDAYGTLGVLYWEGHGVAKNEQIAILWLDQAAGLGDIESTSYLAVTYMLGGETTQIDLASAAKYFSMCAAAGDSFCQSRLGSAYLAGEGVEQDISRAIELLEAGAEAGDPYAMFDLGEVLLTDPDKNIRNPERGVYWMEKAREDEQFRRYGAQILAEFFEDGIDVTPDYPRAIDLYLEAELPLGAANLLVYGDPNIRDIERAKSILTTCHDNHQYGGCATFLGRMYADVASDLYNAPKARLWFERGAEAEDVDALLELSKIFASGMGVMPDLDLAATYLDEAMKKNDDPNSIRVDPTDLNIAYAELQMAKGNTKEAEQYFRRALLTSTDTDDQQNVIFTVQAMHQLGGLYLQQGRYAASLQLYSVLRREKFADVDAQRLASFFGTIGVAATYSALGDIERAKAIIDYDPVIQLLTKLESTSLVNALGLTVLGALQGSLERYEETNQLLEEALPILRDELGVWSFYTLNATGLLGSTKLKLGQLSEAKALLSETIDGAKSAGFDDLLVFNFAQAELAKVLAALGDDQARSLIEQAVASVIQRLDDSDSSSSIGSITERRKLREVFATYIDLAGKATDSQQSVPLDQTFAVAQYAMSLSVDEAIRNWTRRTVSTSPELADQIQTLTLVQDRSRSLDRLYQRSILSGTRERQAIATQLAGTNAEMRDIKAEIAEMGFRAADLSESQPVSISDVQGFLGENELLLVYMTAKEKSYGWSISRAKATSFEIAADQITLRKKIDALRAGLIPREDGGISEYRNDVAHWLFEKFVRPGLIEHPEVTKLIIVPDGPLIGIPFPALRLSAIPSIDSSGADSGWLISHYSMSLAPSVASLKSLRTHVSSSRADRAFLGFGDPILGESPEASTVPLETYSAYYDTRGLGDASKINSLKRLPETADELKKLSVLLNGFEDDVYLGDQATETNFKGLPLKDFRVLAFATHGLLSGSIVGHGEPALVLTPPNESSIVDDGLLTASEIATLKMDAELVILSACDTAAGGADADAMGLSGLARAFFLAGTRNVLASNWPVNSEAAQQLTTAMISSLKADPDLSYPEALQLAILEVQASAETELARHPVYWAPFVVIGQ